MKTLFFALVVGAAALISCTKKENNFQPAENQVLLLKVDYLSNRFEEGRVLPFSASTTTFTTQVIDTPPTDFGSIKVMYQELNEPIFYGTIHWMGLGERRYPEVMVDESYFDNVLTEDLRMPLNGFEEIYIHDTTSSYSQAWQEVQKLVVVRQFLESNPNEKVRVFLYTPSVGVGNPNDWDWYFILKN